jgi:hypothetical protein
MKAHDGPGGGVGLGFLWLRVSLLLGCRAKDEARNISKSRLKTEISC